MRARKKMKDTKEMSAKTEKGRNTDQTLLEIVRRYPGLSQYEIARKLKWTIGRVDGGVRRLLNSGEVYMRVIARAKGRKVNLVYPKGERPIDVIEVPETLLETGNPIWQNEAYIYALDNVTLGISGEPLPDWDEISCFNSKVPIRKGSNGKIFLKIPEKFVHFYNLEKKHKVVFLNGNNILVTVSGDIVEIKRYPS